MAEKVIVSKNKVTALGDAIRGQGFTDAQMTFDEMAQEVTNIPFAKLVDRYISKVDCSAITSVGKYAFKECSYLTTVNVPNATTIRDEAFRSCSSLTSVSGENVATIGMSSFESCFSLTSVDLPSVTRIESNAFKGCSALTEVNFPEVQLCDAQAFSNCTSLSKVTLGNVEWVSDSTFRDLKNLTEVNLPNTIQVDPFAFMSAGSQTELVVNAPLATLLLDDCFNNSGIVEANFPSVELVGQRGFSHCIKLTKVDMPLAIELNYGAFEQCSALKTARLPRASYIYEHAFYMCSNLKKVELGDAGRIPSYSFENCYSLQHVIFRSERLPEFFNESRTRFDEVFTNCLHFNGEHDPTYNPDSLRDGCFYVPRALKSAAWTEGVRSFLRDEPERLRAIEDYPEICNFLDEDDEEEGD